MKRKQISVPVDYGLSLYDDFNGSLEELLLTLQDAQRKAEEKGLTDVEISFSVYEGGEAEISLTGKRWETDAEFEKRKVRSEKAALRSKVARKNKVDKKERQERDLLARLKLKYEGKATFAQ